MAHILIVDDDELIAQIASEILIDAGHAAGWVTDGESAWPVLKRGRPDLVLMDQDMPGISGVGLLRQLRSSSEFYDLPVIMFTAIHSEADENRAIYAGAQDYIRKPFTADGLRRRVSALLAQREAVGHIDLRTRIARDAGIHADTACLPQRRWI